MNIDTKWWKTLQKNLNEMKLNNAKIMWKKGILFRFEKWNNEKMENSHPALAQRHYVRRLYICMYCRSRETAVIFLLSLEALFTTVSRAQLSASLPCGPEKILLCKNVVIHNLSNNLTKYCNSLILALIYWKIKDAARPEKQQLLICTSYLLSFFASPELTLVTFYKDDIWRLSSNLLIFSDRPFSRVPEPIMVIKEARIHILRM
jgi:hypothetical protein